MHVHARVCSTGPGRGQMAPILEHKEDNDNGLRSTLVNIPKALETLGSAAGVAALITSLFNLYSVHDQNLRLLEVEAVKQSAARETFIYTKLFDAASDIQKLPRRIYDPSRPNDIFISASDRRRGHRDLPTSKTTHWKSPSGHPHRCFSDWMLLKLNSEIGWPTTKRTS